MNSPIQQAVAEKIQDTWYVIPNTMHDQFMKDWEVVTSHRAYSDAWIDAADAFDQKYSEYEINKVTIYIELK